MNMKAVFTHVTLEGVAHVIAYVGPNKYKSQITSISINSKIKYSHSVLAG